jgi:hypothetical protein
MDSDPISYRVSDLSNSLLERITRVLQSHSTALIQITQRADRRQRGQLIGSGTFVLIDGIAGILTAQHVTQLLDKSAQLGLILVEEEHSFTIDVQHLTIVELTDRITPGNGPDLAFIQLPLARVLQIKPYRSFWNLSVDREAILTNPPPHNAGVWFVCGVPDERTSIEPSTAGFGRIMSFNGFCGAGGPSSEYEKDNYDYFDFDVEYKDTEDIPTNFGGVSGGALWQVILRGPSPARLEPARYMFCGVPFYQSELRQRRRIIRCHGRKSIYDALFQMVKEKCA